MWIAATLLLSVLGFAQAQTGTISGRIVTTDGQLAAGIRVGAIAAPVADTTAIMRITETDAAGQYRLENIPPGRYVVTAGPVDVPAYHYYPGTSAVDKATVVTVTAGATASAIDFHVSAVMSVTVSGRVVESPVQSTPLTIRMLTPRFGTIKEAAVRADGSFQFDNVRPGTYQLRPSNGRLTARADLTVAGGDVNGIELAIIGITEIKGSVVLEGGGLPPLMTLSFVPNAGARGEWSVTTTRGNFSAELAEGDYRLSWSRLPDGFFVKSIMHGSTDLVTSIVEGQTTPGMNWMDLIVSDPAGTFPIEVEVQPDGSFKATLPEGDRRIEADVVGLFTVKSFTYGSTNLLRDSLKLGASDSDEFRITLTKNPPAPPPPSPTVAVSSNPLAASCLSCPPPDFPTLARIGRITDTVVLRAIVGKDGNVRDVAVIRGHKFVEQAATDAVLKWKYTPQLQNGEPVEVLVIVSIGFRYD